MPKHLDVLKQALHASPDFAVLLQLYMNDFETKQISGQGLTRCCPVRSIAAWSGRRCCTT